MKHIQLFESFDSQQTPIDQRLLGISKESLTEEKILDLVATFIREDNPEAIVHLLRLAINYKPGLFLKHSPEWDQEKAIRFTENLGKIINEIDPRIFDRFINLDFAPNFPSHLPTLPIKKISMTG